MPDETSVKGAVAPPDYTWAMAGEADYYGILHVQPDAPPEIIRASYRTLMHALRLHPDRGGSNEQAALINQAYRVLSNPSLRAEYDRNRAAQTATGPIGEPEHPRCLFCGFAIPPNASRSIDATCGRCASPLARAERHRLERSTRRMLRRTERRLPVRATVRYGTPAIEGMMLNLSLNGMLFESAREFEANQLIRLDTELCRALARVTHCRSAGDRRFSTGVEFVTIMFSSTRGTFVSGQA